MPVNKDFIQELLIEPTPEDLKIYKRMGLDEYVSPLGKRYPLADYFNPPKKSSINRDFVESLAADEHKEVQENKVIPIPDPRVFSDYRPGMAGIDDSIVDPKDVSLTGIKAPLREDPVRALKQVPKGLTRGTENVIGTFGSMAQWVAERTKIGEVLTKHVNLPGAGVVAEYLIRKFGPKKPREFFDKQMAAYAKQGEKWADFWEEQAQKGWEAPDPEVMQAKWRDMPITKGAATISEAAPNYLAAIAGSALTKSPQVGLLFISSLSGAGQYRRQRKKGAGVAKANAIAALTGAWEYITEKIPFDEVFKPAKSKFLKMLKIGTMESAQEFLQGIGENFLEYFGYKAKDLKSVPTAVKEGLEHTMDDWVENVVAGYGLGMMGGGIVPKGALYDSQEKEGMVRGEPQREDLGRPVQVEGRGRAEIEAGRIFQAREVEAKPIPEPTLPERPVIKEKGPTRAGEKRAAEALKAIEEAQAPAEPKIAGKQLKESYERVIKQIPPEIARDIDVKTITSGTFTEMGAEDRGGRVHITGGPFEKTPTAYHIQIDTNEVGNDDLLLHEMLHAYVLKHPELAGEGYFGHEVATDKLYRQIKAQPPAEPAKEEKQPWQMTWKEWLDYKAEFYYGKNWRENKAALSYRGELEKRPTKGKNKGIGSGDELRIDDIQQALSEGKPVPREVLEEYSSEPWAKEALAKEEAPKAEKEAKTEAKAWSKAKRGDSFILAKTPEKQSVADTKKYWLQEYRIRKLTYEQMNQMRDVYKTSFPPGSEWVIEKRRIDRVGEKETPYEWKPWNFGETPIKAIKSVYQDSDFRASIPISKEFENLQQDIIGAEKKAGEIKKAELERKSRIKEARKSYNEFVRHTSELFNNAIKRQQAKLGRELTDEEIQAIRDRYVKKYQVEAKRLKKEIEIVEAQPPAQAKPTGKMPEIASGQLPTEPPGLTKAEAEHLGVGPKAALRAAQKRGLPVGYKKGYQEAAFQGRLKLSILRLDKLIGEKSRESIREVIQQFVPKEEHYRFMLRLARVNSAKDVESITNAIERFIDDYEHRGAVREFKKFVNSINKQFRRGEVKLGELSKKAKEKIAEVLNKYDTVALSEEKTEDLTKHKEHIQRVAGSIAQAFREWEKIDKQGLDIVRLPNRRVDDLERLEKLPVKDLQTEEIEYIQDELESLVSRENRKKEIRSRIRSEYAHTYVTEASNEVADRGLTKRGEAKVPGMVRKFFGTQQANLRSLVRSATTKTAKATEEFLVDRVYDRLREADRVHKEWFLYARELFKNAGISEKTIKELYSDIQITLGGKEYTVPKWTLLNLWLNAEADGNLRRLLLAKEHQLTHKGKTAYIRKIKLGELQDAVERLPESFKKIGEIMFKVNREKNAPAINETSTWERGYPIAIYDKYFPFPRKMRNVPEGHRTEIQLALENRGRYMKRTGGTLPHIFKDPLLEFINGMQLDAQYHSLALVLQDAKALLADNKWRTRMDKAGNKPIVDAIIKMYQRAEGMSTDRNIADVLAGKFLSTMGKGTLSLRPSGGFVQTASLPAAYSVTAEKYFKSSYIPKPSDAKSLMEIDPTMWWRWENRRFDYVLGAQSGENSVTKLITGKDMIRDSLVKHYTWGDQWAVLKIWDAAKNQIEATTELKRDSKDFEEKALKLFHRAMETQPQWDTWHRSIFTSEPRAFPRSFAMFMSARNAQYNVLLQARDDYAKGRIDKDTYGRRVGDIVEANLRVSILRRLFRKLVKYIALLLLFGMGKRDEEDIKAHIKKDFKLEARKIPTETVFNMVGLPVYGNIIANLADEAIKGFEGKWSKVKYGDVRTGSVLMDFIVDLGLAHWTIGKFGKDLALQDRYQSGPHKGELKWKYSGYDAINNISEIISQLTGIGYSGPRADIVWPVKEGAKKAEDLGFEYKLMGMTVSELKHLRRENTYPETFKGKINGEPVVRIKGQPHKGREKLVEKIDKELARKREKK